MSQKCSTTFCQSTNLKKPAIVLVTFFLNYCVFQDHTSEKMIGNSNERNGLYYLEIEEGGKVQAYQIKGTAEGFFKSYWPMHERLRHPSSAYLQQLYPKLCIT